MDTQMFTAVIETADHHSSVRREQAFLGHDGLQQALEWVRTFGDPRTMHVSDADLDKGVVDHGTIRVGGKQSAYRIVGRRDVLPALIEGTRVQVHAYGGAVATVDRAYRTETPGVREYHVYTDDGREYFGYGLTSVFAVVGADELDAPLVVNGVFMDPTLADTLVAPF